MIKWVFVLVVCLVSTSPAQAQNLSGEPLLATLPFAPYLTINKNPQICSTYRKAWVEVYKTDNPLLDSAVDLKTTFPNANHISPAEGKANAGYVQHSDIDFDFDGDGTDEVLYLERHEIGWRYHGMGLYLYDTREDFDFDAQLEQVSSVNGKARFKTVKPEASKAKALASYPKLRRASVFQIEGKLYAQSNVSPLGSRPNKISLDRIAPNQPPMPICEVSFFKPVSSAKPELDILGPLLQIYGEPKTGGMCYGTMGFTALPISAHIPDMLYRPQAMGFRYARTSQAYMETDTARELRFIAWGLSDPSSFEIIRDLKGHYPKFIGDFTNYYKTYFGMEETEAKDTADRAYRHLLDNVYYARQSGPQMYIEYINELDFGPHMSLEQIASTAIDNALEKKDGHPQVLALGIMTGLDAERLKKLTTLVLDLKTRYGGNYQAGMEAPIIQSLFLTASRHPQMRDHFLKLGAKPDASTNYFGKTALMYAAQNNDLDAVVALLSYEADPNVKTQVVNPSCENTALKRDNRTALMYAAESADPTLLLTLIEAGADIAAKDSEGNDIAWYLERNETLAPERIAKMQARLEAK